MRSLPAPSFRAIKKTGYMPGPTYSNFQERVVQAAEAVLKHSGSVGPLELFQQMQLLQPVHFEAWRKGNEHYRVLQQHIQVGHGSQNSRIQRSFFRSFSFVSPGTSRYSGVTLSGPA